MNFILEEDAGFPAQTVNFPVILLHPDILAVIYKIRPGTDEVYYFSAANGDYLYVYSGKGIGVYTRIKVEQ